MPPQEHLVMTTHTSMAVAYHGMCQASTKTSLPLSVTTMTCVITVYVHIFVFIFYIQISTMRRSWESEIPRNITISSPSGATQS